MLQQAGTSKLSVSHKTERARESLPAGDNQIKDLSLD